MAKLWLTCVVVKITVEVLVEVVKRDIEEGKRAVREETYAIDGPTQQRSTVTGHVVLIFRVSNATFSFPLLQHRPME